MVHGNKKQPGRLTPGSNNSESHLHHNSQQLQNTHQHHHHHHQHQQHHVPSPAAASPLGHGGSGGAGTPSSSATAPSSLLLGNNNPSNGGGGARQTGTVPKTRKNSVPQEIVAPTRRDLQQHLTELVHWASSAAPSPTNSTSTHTAGQHRGHNSAATQSTTTTAAAAAHSHSKQRNIRTPGEGTCFDHLDNLALQDHSSRFIPVRPIVRGSYLSEDLNAEHLPHTTIGVVIPTTPSSSQQESREQNDPIWQHIISPQSRQSGSSVGAAAATGRVESRSFRIIPDGAPAQPTSSRQSNRGASGQRRQLDDRILEIQDYIRATSSLINTINQEKIVTEQPKMVNEHLNGSGAPQTPINSVNLETLASSGSESELNGPRPQSVASIHSTTAPGTPDYDDLQQKLQSSTRNMDMIREQQNQIIRLQQAAKSQLEDMERERQANSVTSNLLSREEPPSYETVTEVQDDVASLMNRMRTLTTFVDNQNELANMLGGELLSDELLAEQAMLSQKVEELKSKRGQMADLVSELQSMNSQADESFAQETRGERIVPIEMLSQNGAHQLQNVDSGTSLDSDATLMNSHDGDFEDNNDSELYESESLASGANGGSVVAEKLAEINAMKDQLKRLQNMMSTVKMIETKVNGPDPVEMARATEEVDRLINEIPEQQPQRRREVSVVAEKPQPETEPQRTPMDPAELEPVLSERVQALHAMTADLRVQALSLAAERDRLRVIKDEMIRRKAEEQEERASERSSNSTIRESGATSLNYSNSLNLTGNREASEQRKLKDEYEVKKREYESVLEKMQNVVRRQSQSQPRQVEFLSPQSNEGHEGGLVNGGGGGLSKKMQNDQAMGYGGQQQPQSPAGINFTPWRRTPSISSPIVATGGPPVPTQQNMSATIAQLQDQQTMFQQGMSGGGFHQAQQEQQQGVFNGGGSMDGGGYRGDSLLLQQFIQTQQMLINSISQCNQLLWAQQRELNNLNNAVLMLQERLLKHELCNTVDTSLSMSGAQSLLNQQQQHQQQQHHGHLQREGGGGGNNRAESVPPVVTGLLTTNGNVSNLIHHHHQQQQQQQQQQMNNLGSFMRAQSEQPFFGHSAATSTANFGNAPQTPLSPVSIYPIYNNQQSMLRNGQQQQHQQQQQMQAKALNNMTNNLTNNRIARVTGNVQMPQQQQHQQHQGEHHLFGNNILNLNPLTNNSNNLNQNANLDHLPPLHHHFGGGVGGGGGGGGNGGMHSHMLNNQVAPGNRANNYWDNFRSYSRQNLLSGNTCKSNEESCASSSSNYQPPTFVPATSQPQQPRDTFLMHPHPNQQQQQLHQSRIQQVLFGKGFQQHFRNTIMDMQQPSTGSAPAGFVLNNLCRNNNNLILDNLQQLGGGDLQSVASSSHNDGLSYHSADILGSYTNPINLGVNAEFTAKSKTLPKGNKKRRSQTATASAPSATCLPMPSSTTSRRQNQTDGGHRETETREDGEEANLNLASATSTNVRSKSTSKFFEALKENVRSEVSNLIETNDLRPYFLIQLFRDLQLMCSSDPTRHQTLQSIQNMYNRYVESAIQEEAMFGGAQLESPLEERREEEEEEEEGENFSADEMMLDNNRMLVNDLRMGEDLAKTDNDLARRRRDNQVEEDSLRRNRRRYRNRVNELANKQNFLEQRLGLGLPTSSGSSHSTPIRSVNDLIPVTATDEDGASEQVALVAAAAVNEAADQYPTQETATTTTSSSNTSSISSPSDCETVRIVMKEIAEYLQSVPSVIVATEPVLERIATIIITHLNNPMNERLLLTSVRRIERPELMVQLRGMAGKRNKMLRRMEQYLQGRFGEGTEGISGEGPECLLAAGGREEEEDSQRLAEKKQNNRKEHKDDVLSFLMGGGEMTPQRKDTRKRGEEEEPVQGNGGDGAGDLLQLESMNGAETEVEQVEQVWATDEEVEVLSTNDDLLEG